MQGSRHRLRTRLTRLPDPDVTFALLAGSPSAGVALVALRPNDWCESPVALLEINVDERDVDPPRPASGSACHGSTRTSRQNATRPAISAAAGLGSGYDQAESAELCPST